MLKCIIGKYIANDCSLAIDCSLSNKALSYANSYIINCPHYDKVLP